MTSTNLGPGVGLKDFQRDTVAHVLHRLYDDALPTDRFLVADEVGLGKTLVARGVIEGAIERLQRYPAVSRIDVVYICSNSDIARQNIAKLDVRGDGTKPLSTRITMLATQLRDLNRASTDGSKTVNLIAFTPGTSFDTGQRGGRVQERALLFWMLMPELSLSRRQSTALERILRLDVAAGTWAHALDELQKGDQEPEATVVDAFRASLPGSQLRDRLLDFIDAKTGKSNFSTDEKQLRLELIGELRGLLAKVSVDCLEPDLVILDEFQRFKHLLDNPTGGPDSEVGELAHALFNFPKVKVLLLSATPYKMFTLSDEKETTGDDHYSDFVSTVRFLGAPRLNGAADQLTETLRDFRRRVVTQADPLPPKQMAEAILRQVMCRTERPVSGVADMLHTRVDQPAAPTADDLLGFVALQGLADELEAPLSIEYWKSAPYFLNFMDGYQLSTKFREHEFDDTELRTVLKNAQVLRRSDTKGRRDIDPANPRLRQLMSEVIESGQWQMLWIPPSMPYHAPAGVYADVDSTRVTKRLIFSSWAAAPTAIASIISNSATRRMTSQAIGVPPTRARLAYRIDEGRPAGMTALALFVPTPRLAQMTDPLDLARSDPARLLGNDEIVEMATNHVWPHLPPAGQVTSQLSRDTWFWAAPFLLEGLPAFTDLQSAISATAERTSEDIGLERHLALADEAALGAVALPAYPPDLARWTALVGMAGPANVAWRALTRVTAGLPAISTEAIRQAAAVVASGFRSLFNRPEVMALLDQRGGDEPYWQTVLEYCHGGNLQAVLDEYMHHLVGNSTPQSDEALMQLATDVQEALALRTANLRAFDPQDPDEPLMFPVRFALRYGSARGATKDDQSSQQRQADVQKAFNSPFWPMVLASTSVGQEGVDFHWWCHSLVHWNLPANPVDFEQREGRVHRFKGHAVRRNVAAAHRVDALTSGEADPWIAAFAAAERERSADTNDLWPWWTYPGPTRIERWIPSLPLSRDHARDARLQRQRATYRLAFGQPRQEDLLAILESQGYADDPARTETLRIDLRPPRHSGPPPNRGFVCSAGPCGPR